MATDRTPPGPSAAHRTHAADETCPHCGAAAGVERAYDLPDRMMQALLHGLSKQHGAQVYRRSPRATTRVYVLAPDAATLDRIDARLRELWPALDTGLANLAREYIRAHTGVTLDLDPRR